MIFLQQCHGGTAPTSPSQLHGFSLRTSARLWRRGMAVIVGCAAVALETRATLHALSHRWKHARPRAIAVCKLRHDRRRRKRGRLQLRMRRRSSALLVQKPLARDLVQTLDAPRGIPLEVIVTQGRLSTGQWPCPTGPRHGLPRPVATPAPKAPTSAQRRGPTPRQRDGGPRGATRACLLCLRGSEEHCRAAIVEDEVLGDVDRSTARVDRDARACRRRG